MSLYTSADYAAIAALTETNPRSIRENIEYGGFIYRHPSGGYGYTPPHRIGQFYGNLDGVQLPRGCVRVGMYHCHGAYTTGRAGARVRTDRAHADRMVGPFGDIGPDDDHYSERDLMTADQLGRFYPGFRSYLGTPSGVFYKYDTRTSSRTLLPPYRPLPIRN